MKQPLDGRVFVFTGDMDMPREEARERVVLLGARVTTAVSGKTTHLVAGSGPGETKLAKARELGTDILTEEDFLRLLGATGSSPLAHDKILAHLPGAEPPGPAMDTAMDTGAATGVARQARQPWAEKYRPARREDLVGNPSVIDQLDDFLRGKTASRAALLSGSPGIGKTSSALLLSRLNNCDPIEFNASSLRNKGSLVAQVKQLIGSQTLHRRRRVIIMDEVDGMASDRGGIPELVSIIKGLTKSDGLIVCICNDRNHPKMRTLASHCLDLRFRKLDPRQLVPRLRSILAQEGLSIEDAVMNDVIHKCASDMRYTLNTLQHMKNATVGTIAQKNMARGTFELVAELFQRRPVDEKIALYFADYSLLPLFVHENYPRQRLSSLAELAEAANSISQADVIDTLIHGPSQEWSLMPWHAFFSAACPTRPGALRARIDFPLILGQISRAGKNRRAVRSVAKRIRGHVDANALGLYAGKMLAHLLIESLGRGDVARCVADLEDLGLCRDDLVALDELAGDGAYKRVPARVKAALTREAKRLGDAVVGDVAGDAEDEEE